MRRVIASARRRRARCPHAAKSRVGDAARARLQTLSSEDLATDDQQLLHSAFAAGTRLRLLEQTGDCEQVTLLRAVDTTQPPQLDGGLFAVDRRVSTTSLVEQRMSPDVQLFAADGITCKPTPLGEPDSLSLGSASTSPPRSSEVPSAKS